MESNEDNWPFPPSVSGKEERSQHETPWSYEIHLKVENRQQRKHGCRERRYMINRSGWDGSNRIGKTHSNVLLDTKRFSLSYSTAKVPEARIVPEKEDERLPTAMVKLRMAASACSKNWFLIAGNSGDAFVDSIRHFRFYLPLFPLNLVYPAMHSPTNNSNGHHFLSRAHSIGVDRIVGWVLPELTGLISTEDRSWSSMSSNN